MGGESLAEGGEFPAHPPHAVREYPVPAGGVPPAVVETGRDAGGGSILSHDVQHSDLSGQAEDRRR